jgi:MFS transporter, DHA1 family, multidrug resistance protein
VRLDSRKPIPYPPAMMLLRPGTLGLTALLAFMTALGPLSTDLYLPSLPGMARALGSDLQRVQLTLSAYLFAFAVGQLIYGPVGDAIGRKPAIMGGLALYACGSALCAVAPTTETLIGARIVQALGAAGPIVLARAIVRDIYEGDRAAQELSRMGMIMGLVPALAPFLGSIIDPLFGWRANFIALLTAGLGLATVVWLLLPETAKSKGAGGLSFGSAFGSFGLILKSPVFRTNVALNSLTFCGLFSFISGSSFVLQDAYGLSPVGFAVAFSMVCLGFIAGAVTTQAVIRRLGIERMIRIGILCLSIGGIGMVSLMLAGAHPLVAVALPMAVYTFGVGFILPSASAAAMMPFPERAGAASSLAGLIQSGSAAFTAALMAAFLDGWPMLLSFVICGMGLAAAAVALFGRRVHSA